MQLEDWSGYLEHTIYQDFYATMINQIITAVIVVASVPYTMEALGRVELQNDVWWSSINRAFSARCLKKHTGENNIQYRNVNHTPQQTYKDHCTIWYYPTTY